MNHYKLVAISLLIVLSVLSCKEGTETPKVFDNSYATEIDSFITVDVYNSPKLDQFFYDQEFLDVDSVHIVPLEYGDVSFVNKIDKCVVTPDSWLVFDKQQSKVFRFNRHSGEYLNSFGAKGRGPFEYIRLSDFTYNEERNIVLLCDEVGDQIIRYDINGKGIPGGTYKSPPNLHIDYIEYYNGKIYGLRAKANRTKDPPIVVVNPASNTIEYSIALTPNYFEDQVNPILAAHVPIQLNKSFDGIYVTQLLNDTVYKIVGDGALPVCSFEFNDLYPSKSYIAETDISNVSKRQEDLTYGMRSFISAGPYFLMIYTYYTPYPMSRTFHLTVNKKNLLNYKVTGRFRFGDVDVWPIQFGFDKTLISVLSYMNLRSTIEILTRSKKRNIDKDNWPEKNEIILSGLKSAAEDEDYMNPTLIVYTLKE